MKLSDVAEEVLILGMERFLAFN